MQAAGLGCSYPFPFGSVAEWAGWPGSGRCPCWCCCAARALSRTHSSARAVSGVSCGGCGGSATRSFLVCSHRRWARRGVRPGPAAGL